MQLEPIAQVFRCPGCGFFASRLPVLVNQTSAIDEARRERGLKLLRLRNFQEILDRCDRILPSGATLLDVGCAHGWFLDAAAKRGYDAIGIEPDREIAARARASGARVIEGFFPTALPETSRFAAITFNDVLEHLPDPDTVIAQVNARLLPGGIVVINLPVSEGVIFRLSRLAAKLGYAVPLTRMWQVGLPSPHLSYFSSSLVVRLMCRHGLELIESRPLEAIMRQGLYHRICADRGISRFGAGMIFCAALLLRLVIRRFPSDIRYFLFRKPGALPVDKA
ncbi:MAG: class I SAM-dependent methyltransferase [Acetobacteraceae bacterium]|jgi:SAM-dependent methyltransferase